MGAGRPICRHFRTGLKERNTSQPQADGIHQEAGHEFIATATFYLHYGTTGGGFSLMEGRAAHKRCPSP